MYIFKGSLSGKRSVCSDPCIFPGVIDILFSKHNAKNLIKRLKVQSRSGICTECEAKDPTYCRSVASSPENQIVRAECKAASRSFVVYAATEVSDAFPAHRRQRA